MKNLTLYITEDANKPKVWVLVLNDMFSQAKGISKEIVENMITPLFPDKIKTLCKYYEQEDSSNFLAYSPNDDEFLKEENKKKICSQVSEYILKYIIK